MTKTYSNDLRQRVIDYLDTGRQQHVCIIHQRSLIAKAIAVDQNSRESIWAYYVMKLNLLNLYGLCNNNLSPSALSFPLGSTNLYKV